MKALEALVSDKISAVVGNPPYQTDVVKAESEAEHRTVMNVFQDHQICASLYSRFTSLVYPGARWIHRSGKGMNGFGLDQVNSPNLISVYYWPRSRDVFQEVLLGDGITVVLKDSQARRNAWDFTYVAVKENVSHTRAVPHPGEVLVITNPSAALILDKTLAKADELGQSRTAARTTVQKTFGFESNFVALNPQLVGKERPASPDQYCRLLANDAAGKGGRSQWFWIRRDLVKNSPHLIDRWKVIVSSMNPCGARGTGHSPLAELLSPGEIFGRSRIALATFETEEEARNFFTYVQTDFARFHYSVLGDSQKLLGLCVPDLGDYSSQAWPFERGPGGLNNHLMTLFGISAEEEAYIGDFVKKLSPLVKQS